MTDDIGSYRPCILPSPKLFRRMVEERNRQAQQETEEAFRRLEIAIEDALFDEAIDRKISELAA